MGGGLTCQNSWGLGWAFHQGWSAAVAQPCVMQMVSLMAP